jgi:hypothetical protein
VLTRRSEITCSYRKQVNSSIQPYASYKKINFQFIFARKLSNYSPRLFFLPSQIWRIVSCRTFIVRALTACVDGQIKKSTRCRFMRRNFTRRENMFFINAATTLRVAAQLPKHAWPRAMKSTLIGSTYDT